MLHEIGAGVYSEGVPALQRDTSVLARISEPTASYEQRWYLNTVCTVLGDAVALALAVAVALILSSWATGTQAMAAPIWIWLILPAWAAGSVIFNLLPGWGFGPVEELRRLTQLLAGIHGGVGAALALAGQPVLLTSLVVGSAFVVSLFTVPYGRILMRRLLIRTGCWGIPTAVYGAGPLGRRVIQLLRREKGLGYKPVVVFDDNPSNWGSTVDSIPVLGSIEIVMPGVEVAVLAIPELKPERFRQLLDEPLDRYRSTLVIPSVVDVQSLWVRPRDLSGILGLEVRNNLASVQARALKRAMDLVLVGMTAAVWLPICAIIAVLIWWEDGGSPFFAQDRVGAGGESIKTIKFRTMVPNAEDVLQERLKNDPVLRREWEAAYKLRDDPRITSVGAVLRRYSLDELPQLWNVLVGDMSLVGPRPLPQYHHGSLTDRTSTLRKRVRPGLTGLWQISGRSEIGTNGMEKYDPYYVRNWSIWLDAVILVRTLRTVVKARGAY